MGMYLNRTVKSFKGEDSRPTVVGYITLICEITIFQKRHLQYPAQYAHMIYLTQLPTFEN